MFSNIGETCKMLAKILLCLGIIVSVVLGVVLMIYGSNTGSEVAGVIMQSAGTSIVYLGVIVMIVGPFFSIIASIAFYALGQAVENTEQLLRVKSTQGAANSGAQQKGNSKNKTQMRGLSKDFVNEILNTDTEDLKLIVQDQRELYTSEEFEFIKKQLSNRTQ